MVSARSRAAWFVGGLAMVHAVSACRRERAVITHDDEQLDAFDSAPSTQATLEVRCKEVGQILVAEVGVDASFPVASQQCARDVLTFVLPAGKYGLSFADGDAFRPGGTLCATGTVQLNAGDRQVWRPIQRSFLRLRSRHCG